mgnify:CR=1 FL=1
MTNAKMNDIWMNAHMALATTEMLMDMLDAEIDPETGELVLGELRVGMYCDVLASVCSHIKEIANTICSK